MEEEQLDFEKEVKETNKKKNLKEALQIVKIELLKKPDGALFVSRLEKWLE